jgi:hypothetical protein
VEDANEDDANDAAEYRRQEALYNMLFGVLRH